MTTNWVGDDYAVLNGAATFLTLAVLTMIWSAQQNLHWTWLWYVAGIALGLCIIILFALFEKKRVEMLALVAFGRPTVRGPRARGVVAATTRRSATTT